MTSSSINRRRFSQLTASAVLISTSVATQTEAASNGARVRLGAPLFEPYDSPESWVEQVKRLGFGAAYCPIGADRSEDEIAAYERAAKEADIVIAEVGAWSNPIDRDETRRNQALERCKTQLHLADRIGANCCVNIAGSMGEEWHGHHPDNYTQEAFDSIVASVRDIIDAVEPIRTYFTLEPMPWMHPDSPDDYLKLIQAIDRERFAVHLDPVNTVVSPRLYYDNGAMIREYFEKLGPYVKSCHAKDILMRQEFMVHLDEVRPGLGILDYAVFLREASRFPDTPLMLEHLPSAEEYALAADYVRGVAQETGVDLR